MKRIAHYLVLAAILIGVPLGCCFIAGRDDLLPGLKAFPPRTEDWGFHPELLWNYRRPFTWSVFVGYFIFTTWCVYPFIKRILRKILNGTKDNSHGWHYRCPWWGYLGLVELLVAWTLSWNRFDFFASYQIHLSYFPLWIGFILVINALCFMRRGGCPMTDHPLAYLVTFPASSLFWWFFEYLNRYVWNWYYVGISNLGAIEYTIYATICFASVLPAVCAVAALLHTFSIFSDDVFSSMRPVNIRGVRSVTFLICVSTVGLVGLVYVPDYVYPLIWISPMCVFMLIQFLFREKSVLDGLPVGNWNIFFRFAVASLVCGFFWETWNYYAIAKWVYSVPWVHRWQIWEMPVIGFAGYLPFGVECAAVTAWIYPKLVESD